MADLQELRGRIIQVFFKHLTSSNEVAVDMSQEGLAAVITYQKMPKTLLQVQSTQQKPVLDHQLVFFPPSQRLWYRVPWQATWICLKLPKLTEALPSFERPLGCFADKPEADPGQPGVLQQAQAPAAQRPGQAPQAAFQLVQCHPG